VGQLKKAMHPTSRFLSGKVYGSYLASYLKRLIESSIIKATKPANFGRMAQYLKDVPETLNS